LPPGEHGPDLSAVRVCLQMIRQGNFTHVQFSPLALRVWSPIRQDLFRTPQIRRDGWEAPHHSAGNRPGTQVRPDRSVDGGQARTARHSTSELSFAHRQGACSLVTAAHDASVVRSLPQSSSQDSDSCLARLARARFARQTSSMFVPLATHWTCRRA